MNPTRQPLTKPDDMPEDVWEIAYDHADALSDLFGCDEVKRDLVTVAIGKAIVETKAFVWRCYHCGDVFTDEQGARLHFGRQEGTVPACQIAASEGGLVAALREAEEDAAKAWAAIHDESTDAARAYQAQLGRHRQQLTIIEQVGYDRGIADARAYPESLGVARMPSEDRFWRDMTSAPKDGTLILLWVRPTTEQWTPFEDSGDPQPTIGFNNLADTGEDRWQFAGWSWCHDVIVEGHGDVVGWASLPAAAKGAAS